MKTFYNIVNSIFHNIIKLKKFELVEHDENSVLFYNNNCFLFVGQHMGEVFVYLSKEKNGTKIQPLIWGIVNRKVDYKNILPLFSSTDIILGELIKYNLVTEKVLITLFCTDLLDGDFTKLSLYTSEFEQKSKELYNYFNEKYF